MLQTIGWWFSPWRRTTVSAVLIKIITVSVVAARRPNRNLIRELINAVAGRGGQATSRATGSSETTVPSSWSSLFRWPLRNASSSGPNDSRTWTHQGPWWYLGRTNVSRDPQHGTGSLSFTIVILVVKTSLAYCRRQRRSACSLDRILLELSVTNLAITILIILLPVPEPTILLLWLSRWMSGERWMMEEMSKSDDHGSRWFAYRRDSSRGEERLTIR